MNTYNWVAIIQHLTRIGTKYYTIETISAENILVAEAYTNGIQYRMGDVSLSKGERIIGTILIRQVQ